MTTYIEGKAFVPKIEDEELNRLIKTIKPIIRVDDKLYNIELPNLTDIAYTWSPIIKEEAFGLKEVFRIKTDHYCGYYGLFKPSIAEVLSQIPSNLIDNICAFEIMFDTNTNEDVKIYSYGNGHQATTILYTVSS